MHSLFFNYFCSAVIREGVWKWRIVENKRLGTKIAEAYGNAML
jgi:hypothetical protein